MRWILKSIFYIVALVSSVLFCCAFIACGEKSNTAQEEDNSNPYDTDLSIVYYWEGLKDFDLQMSYIDYDYSEVVCKNSEGLTYAVIVDDSGVEYGRQGEYEVKFSVGEDVKTQKVKIYDLPTLECDDDYSLTYSDAISRSAENSIFKITAKDCFGNDIVPAILEEESDNFFKADGSIDYGDYSLTIIARDRAGQSVVKTISVSVLRDAQAEPNFLVENVEFDVVDNEKAFGVDLKNRELVAFTYNDIQIESDNYSFDGNTVKFNVGALTSFEVGGVNNFRVITSGGYDDIDVVITDERDAILDFGGKERQSLVIGDRAGIAQPKKGNLRQQFDLAVSFVSPSGELLDASQNDFLADEVGKYVLHYSASRNGVPCGGADVIYSVHEVYNTFRTEEEREGFVAYRGVYTTLSTVGMVSEFADDVTVGGITGSFMKVLVGDVSYLGFKIPTVKSIGRIRELADNGVEYAFVDIYMTCDNAKRITNLIYDVDTKKGAGNGLTLQPERWNRVRIPISLIIDNYDALNDASKNVLLFTIYNGGEGMDVHQANFYLYFSQMLFGADEPYSIDNDTEYYSFHNESALNKFYFYDDYTDRTVELGATHGGRTDDWAKIVLNGNTWSNCINIVFPVMYTKAELQAKLDAGYTKIIIPVYFSGIVYDGHNSPRMLGSFYTSEGVKVAVDNETLTYIERNLQDVIDNYDALVNAVNLRSEDPSVSSPAILLLYNFKDNYGNERIKDNFSMYIGTLTFDL